MEKFVILLGGDLTPTDRLRQQIAGARVLAADGGMRHAAALAVVPELWLGDFDSTPDDLLLRYADVPKQTFPRAKDMTDGELALEAAFARGADEVILCGAFGGQRTDHTLLHLTMATAQAAKGRNIFLSSGSEEAWPIVPGSAKFSFPENTPFSLINFSEICGLTINNAHWPLDNVTLPFGSSWTVSNIARSDIMVSTESGLGILIADLRPSYDIHDTIGES